MITFLDMDTRVLKTKQEIELSLIKFVSNKVSLICTT